MTDTPTNANVPYFAPHKSMGQQSNHSSLEETSACHDYVAGMLPLRGKIFSN